MSDIALLFENLNLNFAIYTERADVFKEAFTHRSVTYEGGLNKDNERLEFLGDAVLELITTEWLYNEFKDLNEGVLTNYRSALVKRENLANVARKVELGPHLKMSKGEARSGGRDKDYLLANLVEAFIGALYMAGGMDVARDFTNRFIITELEPILLAGDHIDAKSELQELTQGQLGVTPSYEVLSEDGKDHEKEFKIGVYLDEQCLGTGTGRSRKKRKQPPP